jgi:cytochrome P450
MSPIASRSIITRLKRELPPSPPHPAIIQTIGGRRWPYSYLEYSQARCGDTFTLYPLDRTPMVFLASPHDIRSVLTGDATELHPGVGGNVIAPLIGERSFMLLEEDEHVRNRRTITAAFHRQMVAQQTALLRDVAERAVESWPVGSTIPSHPHIRALTLAAILRIIFTAEPSTELAGLHDQLARTLTISDSLLLQGPRLRHLPGWRGMWRRFLVERSRLDEMLYRLITNRQMTGGEGRGGDLLDLLLMAELPDGSPMPDHEVRDNLMSMILAGHETTTGELAWAFQLLAHYPQVQARLAEELRDGDGASYLRATVDETLRHKPVFVFTIPRAAVAPVEIGEWTYRPPTQIAACTYLMHHNPDLYPEPHVFRPERFLGASAQSRTWLPWGGGRKHCLGRHFAVAEIETVLRTVVTTRLILPASDRIERPRWRSAILIPGAGGRVRLQKRTIRGQNSATS